jgi:hypothetical protein|tara:strand:+ start:10337 stop:10519 length:183 start_codon:yes stop_codon:yes gene_type:complete
MGDRQINRGWSGKQYPIARYEATSGQTPGHHRRPVKKVAAGRPGSVGMEEEAVRIIGQPR